MPKFNKIAATVLTGAALATISLNASAAIKPSTADLNALRQANQVCDPVQDDASFEYCVIGEMATIRHRALIDYVGDDGHIVMGSHTRKIIWASKHVTKADKKGLKAAVAQANYGVDPELDAQYLDVVIGAFITDRGRYIDDTVIGWNDDGSAYLTRHSAYISKR